MKPLELFESRGTIHYAKKLILIFASVAEILLYNLKVMLHETIRNDDFQRNTALQHCCDIVSNGYNIVTALQRCVALKIVVANRPL